MASSPRPYSAARSASSMSDHRRPHDAVMGRRYRRHGVFAARVPPTDTPGRTLRAASVTARAGHRRRRGPVGRRGQGQGHRPARQGARLRRALPGRAQRRAHRRRGGERYALQLTPSGILYDHVIPVIGNGVVVDLPTLFDEIDTLDLSRHLVRSPPRLQPGPPHLPVAPGPRCHRRDAARRRQDRHDAQGHRPGLRRQGPPCRHPCRRRARSRRFSELVRARADRREPPAHRRRWRGARCRRRRRARSTPSAPAWRRTSPTPSACSTTPWPPAPTSSSKGPRRRSSTSTTAPTRTSRRRTRPPAARAPAPGSAPATSIASSGSPRPTRPGSEPDRSRRS